MALWAGTAADGKSRRKTVVDLHRSSDGAGDFYEIVFISDEMAAILTSAYDEVRD